MLGPARFPTFPAGPSYIIILGGLSLSLLSTLINIASQGRLMNCMHTLEHVYVYTSWLGIPNKWSCQDKTFENIVDKLMTSEGGHGVVPHVMGSKIIALVHHSNYMLKEFSNLLWILELIIMNVLVKKYWSNLYILIL